MAELKRSCLSEDTILRFTQGRLGPDERKRVEWEIDHCEDCAALVAAAARGLDETAVDPEPVDIGLTLRPTRRHDDEALGRGTVLGRYVVLDHLGAGGLGEVYRAYDPDLDRRVAIKLLKREIADSSNRQVVQQRLVVEARSLARLSHRNVVQVYDVGLVDDRSFIAMELVDGITLGEWLSREVRDWKRIRDIFLEAGEGLAAAHAAGLVHRDFKPSNVLVGADGIVRVLDFGLARVLAGDDDRSVTVSTTPSNPVGGATSTLTGTGELLGTPAYMSPEQHRGERVDVQTDQFSFCVALYEALYGVRPFRGRTHEEIREAACAGKIREPENQRGVPAWLRKAVLRGLSVDPDVRFPSVRALLQALTRDRRARRVQWASVGAGMVLSATAAWGAMYVLAPAPTDLQAQAVEVLSREAKEAAAKFYFVYPPPGDTGYPTAFRKVVELEALDGPAEDLGRERAAALRTEFSATLTRLGDEYWARDGGRPFAIDFYSAALMFTPGDRHAAARTDLSAAALEDLRGRAVSQSFRASELEAAVPMLVLAAPDEAARRERLQTLYGERNAPSGYTRSALEHVLQVSPADEPKKEERGRPVGATEQPTPPPNDQTPTPDVEPEPTPEPIRVERTPKRRAKSPEAVPVPPAQAPSTDGASPEAPPKLARDPELARQEAAAARAAFQGGRLAEAEASFHRALAADPRNLAALNGLSRLHFEGGAYKRSLSFAKRAVRVAPGNATAHFQLGNGYIKVLEYKDAHRAYKTAADLGHPGARRQLEWLESRLGASP